MKYLLFCRYCKDHLTILCHYTWKQKYTRHTDISIACTCLSTSIRLKKLSEKYDLLKKM